MGDSLRRARRAAFAVLAVALVAIAAVATSALGADPKGANGTIKIDGEPFDTHPNNQPHVGCRFQVDFYGFDQGDFNAKVRFELHPPSGRRVLLNDTVFIGEDAAGGGTDLDAQETYNLSSLLRRGEAHPKQGFHVKVTVEAPGAGGKIAKKSKVFWVQQCKPKCGY
jgi:hypothetical protein